MAITAYVLIQTEVGKAANVASTVRAIDGVVAADDVTGPYDVIVRTEGATLDDLGKHGRLADPGGRGHHPDVHLPGRQPLDPAARRRQSSR